MDGSQFNPAAPGTIIKNFEARATFVPHPLPPTWDFPPALFNPVIEVSNLLGRLDGMARALPDKKILIRSFVRREAQLSSYIENTYAGYEEVAAAQKVGHKGEVRAEVLETVNAELAISAGVNAVFEQGHPITLSLIKQMHSLLLNNVRGHEASGTFRTMQVYIGKQSGTPDEARFVPAPPYLVTELMDAFQTYLLGNHDMPALVQIGLLHYQFETIHPFEDGNGRLGRILILLGLCQHRLLSVPLLNPSVYFERYRLDYYDALLRVSTHCDWAGWIEFFVEGIRVAVVESMEKVSELTELQRRYHAMLRTTRNSALLLTLVDNLFVMPVISVSEAALIMGVSNEAARNSVRKLVEAEILNPAMPGPPAFFAASEILNALNPRPTRR